MTTNLIKGKPWRQVADATCHHEDAAQGLQVCRGQQGRRCQGRSHQACCKACHLSLGPDFLRSSCFRVMLSLAAGWQQASSDPPCLLSTKA